MRRSTDSRRGTQVNTVPITSEDIMRTDAFRRGVDEVRCGRSPDFDHAAGDTWDYERGRQWGLIAPRGMPLFIGKNRINPEAVSLFDVAWARDWIK